MRPSRRTLAWLPLLLLAPGAFAQEGPERAIAVRVLDASGAPLEAATVTLTPMFVPEEQLERFATFVDPAGASYWPGCGEVTATARTDAAGAARLASRPTTALAGCFLIVTCPGFATAHRLGCPTADAQVELRLVREALVLGKVLDPDGRPVAGVEVSFDEPPRDVPGLVNVAAVTSADGTFVARGVAPGPHELMLRSRTPGLAARRVKLVAPTTGFTEHRLVAATGIALEVEVSAEALDEELAPTRPPRFADTWRRSFQLERAADHDRQDWSREAAQVDVMGPGRLRVVFRDLAPGRYALSFPRPRRCGPTRALGPTAPVEVEVKRGELTPVRLAVPDARLLRGRTVDPAGAPLPRAQVSFSTANEGHSLRSDAEGRFSIPIAAGEAGRLGAHLGPLKVRVDVTPAMEDLGDLVLRPR